MESVITALNEHEASVFVGQLDKGTRRRITLILACATLVSLGLMLSPLSEAAPVTPVQSSPTFTDWPAWQGYMANIPTPQDGCFVATFPNPAWQPSPCGAATSTTETVGSGNDWVAKAPSGSLIGYSTNYLFAVGGITSEKDVCVGPPPYCTSGGKGANGYSLQINSNFGFPVTYYGRATKGWEQFIFQSKGFSGSCGTSTCGLVWIEYWLVGYYATYGSCPPASQDPPGGGFGWARSGGNCYFNTNGALTRFEPATNLGLLTFSGHAHFQTSTKDQATLCVYGGSCYAKSVTDTVLHLYKHWTQSELNVFGWGNGSRAEFNSGTDIVVQNILEAQNAGSLAVACLKGGTTGETNNLNLGSCSSGSSSITFSESN